MDRLQNVLERSGSQPGPAGGGRARGRHRRHRPGGVRSGATPPSRRRRPPRRPPGQPPHRAGQEAQLGGARLKGSARARSALSHGAGTAYSGHGAPARSAGAWLAAWRFAGLAGPGREIALVAALAHSWGQRPASSASGAAPGSAWGASLAARLQSGRPRPPGRRARAGRAAHARRGRARLRGD